MNASLIPVTPGGIGGHTCLTVDGRTLHSFLEVGKRFADWINDRIQQYSFTEGEDFEVCFPNLGSKERGGHNAKDYRLTLNMAKELAMVERTPRGQQARRYFIACEEELLALKGQPAPELPAGLPNLFPGADQPPSARLDAALLRELRLISPPLAQVYLVEMGITPDYVSGVLERAGIPFASSPALGSDAGSKPSRAAPLDYLRERVERMADYTTGSAWMFLPAKWDALCQPYDARDTLVSLRDAGYLMCAPNRFTSQGPRVRHGRRKAVFAILKSLGEHTVVPPADAADPTSSTTAAE